MYRKPFSLTLFILVMAVYAMPTVVFAIQIDQSNDKPIEENNYGISGITYNRWEGQFFTPELPVINAVDFGGLLPDEPWNTLPADTTIELRLYANSGGIPGKILASKALTMPIGKGVKMPVGNKELIFTPKFTFDTPVDVSAYIGIDSSLMIALCVVDDVEGNYCTLFSNTLTDPPQDYYDKGMAMVSYDQGAKWQMVANRDQLFHTYGVPEPAMITLLIVSIPVLLRKLSSQ